MIKGKYKFDTVQNIFNRAEKEAVNKTAICNSINLLDTSMSSKSVKAGVTISQNSSYSPRIPPMTLLTSYSVQQSSAMVCQNNNLVLTT